MGVPLRPSLRLLERRWPAMHEPSNLPPEVADTYEVLLARLPEHPAVLVWWVPSENSLGVSVPFGNEWVYVKAPVDGAPDGEWLVEHCDYAGLAEDPLYFGPQVYAATAEVLIALGTPGEGRQSMLEHLNRHLLKAGEVWRALRRDHLEHRHEDHREGVFRCLCPECRSAELVAASRERSAALLRRDRYADIERVEVEA